MRLCIVSALILTSFASASAVELHHVKVRTGTDGLEPMALAVSNAGQQALTCNADIAHWYSVEIAGAAPGKTARIELWFDPETGTYTALNDKRENLPVERLWCGLAGRAYATRAQIALDRGSGAFSATLGVTCRDLDNRLVCE
jgi:hypothetical protein